MTQDEKWLTQYNEVKSFIAIIEIHRSTLQKKTDGTFTYEPDGTPESIKCFNAFCPPMRAIYEPVSVLLVI